MVSLALNLGAEQRFKAINELHFDRRARRMEAPPKFALSVVKETVASARKEWGQGSAGSWVARRYPGMPLCPLGRAFGSAAATEKVDRLAGEWSPAWGLLSFSERDWTTASTPPATRTILFLTLRLRGEMFYALC